MNLHALRIFSEVARRGSLTLAARALFISQPAVTLQLRNLEKELGVPLIVQEGRGIALTDVGRRLSEYAIRLFSLENEMEAYIEGIKNGKIGVLCVAATYLPANVLLPQWLTEFTAMYADVELQITTTNARGAFQLLRNHQVEVALVGGGWEEAGISWDVLFEDELWFIVPNDHALAGKEVTLQEMMKEKFVIREEGSSTRERFLSMCQTYNVNPPMISMKLTGLNETIRAVIAGYGANLISAMAVADYVDRQEVARVYVRDVLLKRPISLCIRREGYLSPAAIRLIELIKKKFA